MDRKMDVVALLKARGEASLSEIAAHLGVSKQGALRHLEALQTKRLVEVTTEGHHGPGRPGHVYRLTEAAIELFPSSHRQLAGELVDFMEGEELERFFKDRGARTQTEYETKLRGLDFKKKVRELARLTTQAGHMTEVVEGREGTVQLRHCNCPIQDVAERTGLPCQHEMDMYHRLLQTEVTRSTWVGAGDTDCTYEISTTNREGKQIG